MSDGSHHDGNHVFSQVIFSQKGTLRMMEGKDWSVTIFFGKTSSGSVVMLLSRTQKNVDMISIDFALIMVAEILTACHMIITCTCTL